MAGMITSFSFVGSKSKGPISKRVATKQNTKFSEKRTFTLWQSVFGKFGVFCFLVTLVLRFALLPYYRRFVQRAFELVFPTKTTEVLVHKIIRLLEITVLDVTVVESKIKQFSGKTYLCKSPKRFSNIRKLFNAGTHIKHFIENQTFQLMTRQLIKLSIKKIRKVN